MKDIPYFKPDAKPNVDLAKRRGEFMDENVLANCMFECNLTIKDLVEQGYRPMEGSDLKPPELVDNTTEGFISRVLQKQKNP